MSPMKYSRISERREIQNDKKVVIVKKPLKFNKGILIPDEDQLRVIKQAQAEHALIHKKNVKLS